MFNKLTKEQREEVKKKKAYHTALIKQGRYAEARRCGPKVIAMEYGIDRSMVYRY